MEILYLRNKTSKPRIRSKNTLIKRSRFREKQIINVKMHPSMISPPIVQNPVSAKTRNKTKLEQHIKNKTEGGIAEKPKSQGIRTRTAGYASTRYSSRNLYSRRNRSQGRITDTTMLKSNNSEK